MKFRTLPVTDFEQNCSVIWCEMSREGAVIDPGGDIGKIIRVIKRENLTLKCILLTHGHIDHVAGAAELSALTNAPIIGPHKADSYWLNLLPEEAAEFDFPNLEKLVPDQWLNDKDKLFIGNQRLDVLHCPGHTPGHVAFFHANSKTAFVGDILFKDSIGSTEFEGGNEEQLMDSIIKKLLPLGDDVSFVSGHGPNSTFGREKRKNAFLVDAILAK